MSVKGGVIERMSELTGLSVEEVTQKIDDIRHMRVNPSDDPAFLDAAKQTFQEISPTGLSRMEFEKRRFGLEGDQGANFIGRKVFKEIDDINTFQEMRAKYEAEHPKQETQTLKEPAQEAAQSEPTQNVQEQTSPTTSAPQFDGPTSMLKDPEMSAKISAAMDDVATQLDGTGISYGDVINFHYNGFSSIEDQLTAAGFSYDEVDKMLKSAMEKQGVEPELLDMGATAMARSPHKPEVQKNEQSVPQQPEAGNADNDTPVVDKGSPLPGDYGDYTKFYDDNEAPATQDIKNAINNESSVSPADHGISQEQLDDIVNNSTGVDPHELIGGGTSTADWQRFMDEHETQHGGNATSDATDPNQPMTGDYGDYSQFYQDEDPETDAADDFEAYKQQVEDEFAAFAAETQAEFDAFKNAGNDTQEVRVGTQPPQVTAKGIDI